MKRLILLLLAVTGYVTFIPAVAQDADKLLKEKLEELDHVVERRDTYYMAHEHYIDSLKRVYAQVARTDDRRRLFDVTNSLYMAYKSFQNDSARAYNDRELALACELGDKSLIVRAQCDNLFTYMSRGDFTNAVEVLRNTDLQGVDDSLKADFYVQAVRLYSDLSNFTSERYEDKYAILSRAYSDTVMKYAQKGSYPAQFASNFLNQFKKDAARQITTYESMLRRGDIPMSIKAMLHSMLADVYINNGNTSLGLMHKAESAIIDIKEATRETTSKHFLAYELYERGDIDRASRLIHAALEDAEAYNAPQRKAEIGRSLSLIEASKYNNVNHQRLALWYILGGVALLALGLGLGYIFIRRKNRLLNAQKQIIVEKNSEITEANSKLTHLNEQLNTINARIRESVRIKDEYIGYGFHLNSEYIDRIEGIYKLVSRKLAVGQADDHKHQLKLSDLKDEKLKMLKEFDATFLRLFPTFAEQYSELFPPEDATRHEIEDGMLTPEMRIFALIRLGVTDNNNIARFLNYSVNTINTYKTKAKKRSIVPNDEFEERIMEIRSVK